MGQRTITAYFQNASQAETVATKLKSLRAEDVSIGPAANYTSGAPVGLSNPITSGFPGMAALSIGGTFLNPNGAIFAAYDPMAYGMSEFAGDNLDCLLTATIDDETYDQAIHAISDGGGRV